MIADFDAWDLISCGKFVHSVKVYTIKIEHCYGCGFFLKGKKYKEKKSVSRED